MDAVQKLGAYNENVPGLQAGAVVGHSCGGPRFKFLPNPAWLGRQKPSAASNQPIPPPSHVPNSPHSPSTLSSRSPPPARSSLEVASLLVALYALVMGPYSQWKSTVVSMLTMVTAILVPITNL